MDKPTKTKQVIVEIPEDWHAELKARAGAALRKIPAQLLFEAFEYHKIITAKKGGAKK